MSEVSSRHHVGDLWNICKLSKTWHHCFPDFSLPNHTKICLAISNKNIFLIKLFRFRFKMGQHFGELAKVRGIVIHKISPFEQKAFAGVISKGVPNVFRRCRGQMFRVVPRKFEVWFRKWFIDDELDWKWSRTRSELGCLVTFGFVSFITSSTELRYALWCNCYEQVGSKL